MPDLAKIAEEVEATNIPRELKRDDKTVAVIVPVDQAVRGKGKAKTKADYEAFKSAAGGWKDLVDTERLKQDIYASCKVSTRPPIVL